MTRTRQQLEARRRAALNDLETLTQSQVARKYHVTRSAVSQWAHTGNAARRKPTGRPCKLTQAQLGDLAAFSKAARLNVKELRQTIETRYGIDYSASHIYRLLQTLKRVRAVGERHDR
jgi:transposase